jgi:spermidine synthase
MAASGFAGLGYQIVWTQQGTLWLGHEAPAVLAVVAGFFGGLAVGALAVGPRIRASQRPLSWYVGCEVLIGLWGLLLAIAIEPISHQMLQLIGVQPHPLWQWAVAFAGMFVLLLPATAAMGATLPAMERLLSGHPTGPTPGALPTLYAANTFGAVAGVLATTFWLVPGLGLVHTSMVCVLINLACAAAAARLLGSSIEPSVQPNGGGSAAAVVPLVRLAVTGLLGIGYEVLGVRVLSQVAEDTVYTFAIFLAVYLLGTAAGAAIYRRASRQQTAGTQEKLLVLLAAACLAGSGALWFAERTRQLAVAVLGPSMSAALAAETLTALIAFGPPTLVMGALFSHLCELACEASASLGRALGVNMLGGALAPVLFGAVGFSLVGAKAALLTVSFGYLALLPWRAWGRPLPWLPLSVGAAVAVFAPVLRYVEIPEGGRLVSYQEGVMAAVSVVEDADGVRRLRIDNREQEGTSRTVRVDARQAWLPLLLHPAPRRVLFLGLGTGVTASAAAADPSLEVDAVELVPEVIAAATLFSEALPRGVPDPRLHLMRADARRFVRTTPVRYDVIVADNFHPARSGSGSLYTVEHFAAVRARLDDSGVFCQWLPLHQLDLGTLRSIVRSFRTAFPDGWALLANNSLETPVIGLVGRRASARFDPAAVRARLAAAQPDAPLVALGIEDDFALLGGFIAGPKALAAFAGETATNTDNRPVVAYRAPRIAYAPDSLPRDRLIELLGQLSIEPEELLASVPSHAWAQRLAAYWRARDRFIVAGRHIQPGGGVQDMLQQVREPLLTILHDSPDFRPAYDPLLRMAAALAPTDAPAARALLEQLDAVQPERTDARELLANLPRP